MDVTSDMSVPLRLRWQGPERRREAAGMKPITPRTLDWMEQAPVCVTRTRRIAVDPDRVWAVIADHEGWSDWFGPITKVERIGSGEGVGGGRRVFIKSIGVEEEFLAWEPGSRFAFAVVRANRSGIRSMVEDIRLTPEGDTATTVSYTQAIDPVGSLVTAPLLRRAIPRTLDNGLAGLAQHVGG